MRHQTLSLEDHRALGEKCRCLAAGLDQILVDVVQMEWRPGGRQTLRAMHYNDRLRNQLDNIYCAVPSNPFPPSPYYGPYPETAPKLSGSIQAFIVDLDPICQSILNTMSGCVSINLMEIARKLQHRVRLLQDIWEPNVTIDESR